MYVLLVLLLVVLTNTESYPLLLQARLPLSSFWGGFPHSQGPLGLAFRLLSLLKHRGY
jgi:hypothetical protein